MYDVIDNLFHLIVSLQMETGSVTDRSNNISVSIGLQNVKDRYGTDQKAIQYNGNIVLVTCNYMFKLNNTKTRTWSGIFSNLTIKVPERRQ